MTFMLPPQSNTVCDSSMRLRVMKHAVYVLKEVIGSAHDWLLLINKYISFANAYSGAISL